MSALPAHITASQLERLAACPASATLPHDRRTSKWGSLGTVIHEYLERVNVLGDRDAALLEVLDEHLEACASIDLASLPVHGGTAAEVAYAYDPDTDTAREIGRGMERMEYLRALAPHELGCIVDVVGVSDDGTGYVGDFKTGWGRYSARGWQARLEALVVARTLGVDRVHAEIIRVRERDHWSDSWTYDAFDLAVAAVQVRELVARVRRSAAAGTDASFSPGPHCDYCPANRRCPAMAAMLVALARGQALDGRPPDAPLTPVEAGVAYDRLGTVIKRAQEMRDEIKRIARSSPIPLPDGYFLGEVDGTRTSFDADAAYQAVAATYGEDVGDVLAPPSRAVTKTRSLKAAARLVAARRGGSIASREREISELLVDTGAARVAPFVKVDRYRASACTACGVGQAVSGGLCRDCDLDRDGGHR